MMPRMRLIAVSLFLFAAGCGAPEPCNTDPAQIEALRASLPTSRSSWRTFPGQE